jgi:hypothetical protein
MAIAYYSGHVPHLRWIIWLAGISHLQFWHSGHHAYQVSGMPIQLSRPTPPKNCTNIALSHPRWYGSKCLEGHTEFLIAVRRISRSRRLETRKLRSSQDKMIDIHICRFTFHEQCTPRLMLWDPK